MRMLGVGLFIACLSALGSAAQSETRLAGLQIGTGEAVTIAVLHGDQSSGGDPGYLFPFGVEIARRLPEATVHMLLRPGYRDAWGRQSPGENFGRQDQYTMENARLIADSFAALKGDGPLVAVGHSGGAAQIALALSLDGNLADEIILVGCPCDLDLWRGAHPHWPADIFQRSVSPTSVPVDTKARVTIIVGSGDAVTPKALSAQYAQHLSEQGASATLVDVPEGDHNGNRALSTAWLSAIIAAADRAKD